MEYGLDLRKVRKQTIKRLSDHFYGKDPTGKELIFNNYYMELNGKPFMGISGECHYSRVHEGQWEDTIQRMKMGGINIIATYIFWIHHEEEEGKFRFDGNKIYESSCSYVKSMECMSLLESVHLIMARCGMAVFLTGCTVSRLK